MDNIENAEERKVRLKVLTPLRVVYDKLVEMVIAKTSEGDMGILHGHDARSALLDDGILRILEGGRQNEEMLMVLGGIMTVENNEVAIVSELAEQPDKIQELLAKLEEERAASEIVEQSTDLYTKRMELAIRNALIQKDVNVSPMMNTEHTSD
jgi:F-type H+-transporting ATPase subunit epsilon